MTDERYPRLKQVYFGACERPPEERAAFLDRACAGDGELRAEVESLLAHDREDSLFLETPALGGGFKLLRASAAEEADHERRLPESLGRYRIRGVLGEGGMGVVYLAEQENPRRTVALKVIRPGVAGRETLRRFEREAQLLGRLQHPGIAQIFEAGAAEGEGGPRPFFAMELVRGLPLLAFCREHDVGTRERLVIFVRICEALEHAHRSGVVHRDLKPENVLVEAGGQPKVLDFGVARATDSDVQATTLHTDAGKVIGTLPYMSPEQVTGDASGVDERSDVYALGVLLFELLTGRLPYVLEGRSVAEAARAICEREPTRLSSLDRALRGDLDTIVQKALEKERTRRYASAAELAGDVERFLHDEPIRARPASTLYQLRKFARRNRGLVAGLVVAFATLSLGVVATSIAALRALDERDRARDAENLARARLEETSAVSRLLTDMLTSVRITRMGRNAKVADGLEETETTVAAEFADKPALEAILRSTLGEAWHHLGEPDRACRNFERALELTDALQGADSAQAADLRSSLAIAVLAMGDLEEAERLARQALAVQERALGDEDRSTLRTLRHLSHILVEGRKLEEAEPLLLEVIPLHERLLGAASEHVLALQNLLVRLRHFRGELEGAAQLAERNLAHARSALDPRHPAVLDAMALRTALLRETGRWDEAEPLARENLALREEVYGPEHPETLVTSNDLASLLVHLGRYEEAEAVYRRGLEIARRLYAADHPDTAASAAGLAHVLVSQGRYPEAAELAREALETERRILGDGHENTLVTSLILADALEGLQRIEEAEQVLRRSLLAADGALSTDHPHRLDCLEVLGRLLLNAGRHAEAGELLGECLERRGDVLGADHPRTADTQVLLASVLMARGELERAEALCTQAHDTLRTRLGEGHVKALVALRDLGSLRLRRDHPEEAEPALREALHGLEQALPPGHEAAEFARSQLGLCLQRLGRPEESEPLLVQSYEALRDLCPAGDPRITRILQALVEVSRALGLPGQVARYQALFDEQRNGAD